MSALTDRIRLASRRNFLVIGIFLAAGYWFYQPSPDDLYDSQISSLTSKVAETQKEVAETEVRFNDKAKFQEEMEQVSQTFRLALDYLPKELNTQDLLKKISTQARQAGVDLDRFNPKDTVPKDFYDELPMEIGVRGSYGQLLSFLVSVSKLPRIVTVRNVEIGAAQFTDAGPVMQLTGTLVGYRYKESGAPTK